MHIPMSSAVTVSKYFSANIPLFSAVHEYRSQQLDDYALPPFLHM